MSENVHGEMNIAGHRETWVGFCRLVKWATIGIVIVLILMAIFLT